MEASRLPPREADVAPAPEPAGGVPVGWTVADPAPLGLAGFALTTFILGLVNANAISGKDTFVVLSVAGAYGGLVQLLAGMWAFREGNTFAAAAFSSYGGFWISFVLLIQFFLPETAKAGGALAGNHAIAVYLFCLGVLHVLHVDRKLPGERCREPRAPDPVGGLRAAGLGHAGRRAHHDYAHRRLRDHGLRRDRLVHLGGAGDQQDDRADAAAGRPADALLKERSPIHLARVLPVNQPAQVTAKRAREELVDAGPDSEGGQLHHQTASEGKHLRWRGRFLP